MPIKYGSIREIANRLHSEGYAVSESALRSWIKDGTIRAKYAGKKAYLAYDDVVAALHRY